MDPQSETLEKIFAASEESKRRFKQICLQISESDDTEQIIEKLDTIIDRNKKLLQML